MSKDLANNQTANSTSSDPKQTLKQLIEGNIHYAKKCCCKFGKLKTKQSPKVTLLTCCDSRVPQNLFDMDGLNELFVVKNIGNQFRNSEGSVKYPIIHLRTPLLIVLGHTGCGAIKAALSDNRGEDDAIQRELIGLVNIIKLADQTLAITKVSDENKLALYAQANVDYQIQRILSDFNLKNKVEKQELYVIGMMFDIHCVYGKEAAHTYITNINGVTDGAEIKKMAIVKNLGKNTVDALVKRL
ncbi:MAG: carbonic anhydrase [Candidatus Bathyarchaeota archaeon]|nr:carbonic anhydrase [Candidatus Bathyarchaeota archaeon]